MRKIIFSLSMLVSNPVGLVYVVLTGVAGFTLINTMLPREYFAAVVLSVGLVVWFVAVMLADGETSNSFRTHDDDDELSNPASCSFQGTHAGYDD